MEAAEILSTARSDSAPSNWIILPLRRNQVRFTILGWALGAIMGLGLFIALFLATWPENFEHGAGGIIITGLFLAALGVTGVGSLWLLAKDTRRLLQADQCMIVITPEVYCKQEKNKIDLVPLEEVGFLTTKGSSAPATHASWAIYTTPEAVDRSGDQKITAGTTAGRMLGMRRKPRGPTSVAFVDLRSDKKIQVTNDHSYGHPYEVGGTLSAYVEARLKNMEAEARRR
ncbi:MAG TPA: hypothetical protein VH599_10530 [Ktedonobacterales bacterium]|jgi:hypothetical protein